MEQEKLTYDQLSAQLENTQAVTDQLARRVGEGEKTIAMLMVANQKAAQLNQQLSKENQDLKAQIAGGREKDASN